MPSPKPTRRPRRSFPVDSTIPQRGVPQPWRPTPTAPTGQARSAEVSR